MLKTADPCLTPRDRCTRPILDITYLLTPWSWVLLEELTGSQLVKKFPTIYGTWKFITAFKSARHLSLSWASSIQSAPPHPTSWRSPCTKSLVLFPLLRSYQSISPSTRLSLWTVRNRIRFYGEELLATCPTPKLEDHLLSAVRDCLFNIFASTLHIGGRFSIRSLRKRHAVETETHFSQS